MTFNEKIKADIECLERVLKELQDNNADAISIAIVTGMLDAAKTVGEME